MPLRAIVTVIVSRYRPMKPRALVPSSLVSVLTLAACAERSPDDVDGVADRDAADAGGDVIGRSRERRQDGGDELPDAGRRGTRPRRRHVDGGRRDRWETIPSSTPTRRRRMRERRRSPETTSIPPCRMRDDAGDHPDLRRRDARHAIDNDGGVRPDVRPVARSRSGRARRRRGERAGLPRSPGRGSAAPGDDARARQHAARPEPPARRRLRADRSAGGLPRGVRAGLRTDARRAAARDRLRARAGHRAVRRVRRARRVRAIGRVPRGTGRRPARRTACSSSAR